MTAVLDAQPDAAPAPARAARSGGWRRALPALTILGVGVALTGVYFPRYYDKAPSYDDEGAMIITLQRFLEHGSLYDHTHGSYGPFFFSLVGAMYKLTGQTPTQFTARIIVLVFTLLSVMLFAAAVWKVTRSVTMAVLCEVATFVVLIPYAGQQPLHPGSLIVLLLAVIAYCLVSWLADRRDVYLVVVGIALGGLLMSKINVGVFAVAAIVVAFAVGNDRFPRWFRAAVGIAAVALPFAVSTQLVWQNLTGQFIVLVSFSVLALYVPLLTDRVSVPPRGLLVMAVAAVATTLVSWIWPLTQGTSVSRLFIGVFVQPLGQADHLTIPTHTSFQWLAIAATLVGLGAVIARRDAGPPRGIRPEWLLDLLLALSGLLVLFLGLFGGDAAWLPAIVVLPAVAWLADAPRNVRLALRFLVPLAILQVLHMYPVAGSQKAWGLVTMVVPCAVAIGAGLRRLVVWRTAGRWTRALAVGALCVLLTVGVKQWPGQAWHEYAHNKPVNLRGARLLRLTPYGAHTLQGLTRALQKHCDTFYSTPGYDILYQYTKLPTPTGQLANWPGVLNDREQRDIAYQLRSLHRSGKRVCILRGLRGYGAWVRSSYGKGPLGKAVEPYQKQVAAVGHWRILVYGRGPAPKKHPGGKNARAKSGRNRGA